MTQTIRPASSISINPLTTNGHPPSLSDHQNCPKCKGTMLGTLFMEGVWVVTPCDYWSFAEIGRDHFYLEQIRALYGWNQDQAKTVCNDMVSVGVFTRKYQLMSPTDGVIASAAKLEDFTAQVSYWSYENDSIEEITVSPASLQALEVYHLAPAYLPGHTSTSSATRSSKPTWEDLKKMAFEVQHTMCAKCGEDKHTPLRLEEGYVCLTCVDKEINQLRAFKAAITRGLEDLCTSTTSIS